jgi:hypothetical protein
MVNLRTLAQRGDGIALAVSAGVFWWFERRGQYLCCESMQTASDKFELRLVAPDGTQSVEEFADPIDLTKRQQAVANHLLARGWSGPHDRRL